MREQVSQAPPHGKIDRVYSVSAIQQNDPAMMLKITSALAKRQDGSSNHLNHIVLPREWQISAAAELINKRDVIVVTATGSGTSLCYQLALVCSPDKTILGIFPLLSLMTDQVSDYELSCHNYGRSANIRSWPPQ